MTRKGFPNFTGYSAGSHPTGRVHPEAIKQISGCGVSTEGLRSKSWDEFGKPGAPEMHFVFYGLRQCRTRALPNMAGAAAHGKVERSRSGIRYGHAAAD